MSGTSVVRYAQHVGSAVGHVSREIVLRFCFSFFTVFALLWLAVMMYLSFYYAYMPTVRHVKPVHLQFRSDCKDGIGDLGLCSFPEAKVSLSKGERMLMRGQKYQVFLDLEMPYSVVNEKLGMFMVKVNFLSDSGKVLANSERSCMLHYKSSLLKTITTMFFSLPLIMGLSEEKQNVQLKLFEDYLEDSYHPAVAINVVIFAKKIEIYSSSIRIEACFSGLRYIMFHWPVTSAFVAITSNFLVLCTVFFFAYGAFVPDPFDPEYEDDVAPDNIASVADEQERGLRNGESSLWTRLTSHQTGRLRVRRGHTHCKLRDASSASQLCLSECSPKRGLLRSATFPPYRWGDQASEPSRQASRQTPRPLCRACACQHCADRLDGAKACSAHHHGLALDSGSNRASQVCANTNAEVRKRGHVRCEATGGRNLSAEPGTSRASPIYSSAESLSDQGDGIDMVRYKAVRYKNRERVSHNPDYSVTPGPSKRRKHCCIHGSHSSVCSEHRAARSREFTTSPLHSSPHSPSSSESHCKVCAKKAPNRTSSFSSRVPDGAPSTNERPRGSNIRTVLPGGAEIGTPATSSTAVSAASSPVYEPAHVIHDPAISAARRRSANKTRAKFGLSFRNVLTSRKK